jgi:hypothetical protein
LCVLGFFGIHYGQRQERHERDKQTKKRAKRQYTPQNIFTLTLNVSGKPSLIMAYVPQKNFFPFAELEETLSGLSNLI